MDGRLWSSFCGRPSLMRNIEYGVSSPSVIAYNWKYIAETSHMTLPLHAEFHVAGRVHTHLSELAVKMGKTSDMLYASSRFHDTLQNVLTLKDILEFLMRQKRPTPLFITWLLSCSNGRNHFPSQSVYTKISSSPVYTYRLFSNFSESRIIDESLLVLGRYF